MQLNPILVSIGNKVNDESISINGLITTGTIPKKKKLYLAYLITSSMNMFKGP